MRGLSRIGLVVAVVTFLTVVFGELIPKSLALRFADGGRLVIRIARAGGAKGGGKHGRGGDAFVNQRTRDGERALCGQLPVVGKARRTTSATLLWILRPTKP